MGRIPGVDPRRREVAGADRHSNGAPEAQQLLAGVLSRGGLRRHMLNCKETNVHDIREVRKDMENRMEETGGIGVHESRRRWTKMAAVRWSSDELSQQPGGTIKRAK